MYKHICISNTFTYTCAFMPPWRELAVPPPFFSSLAPLTWLSRSVTLGELPDCPVPDLSTVQNKISVNCKNNNEISGEWVSTKPVYAPPASRQSIEDGWRNEGEREREDGWRIQGEKEMEDRWGKEDGHSKREGQGW